MTNYALSKVFSTGTQQHITPRKPHFKLCSEPYGRHRSRFDPTVTTFDVEDASSTLLKILVTTSKTSSA
jgi:hypothetical protein